MKPLDPRLLRYARAARVFLLLGGVLALARTLAIVAFAWLVAQLVAGAVDGRSADDLAPLLAALLAVVAARAALAWATEVNAVRGGAGAKAQLRQAVLAALVELGPAGRSEGGSGGVVALLGGGLDSLDGYFARYLPQLIATAVATPLLTLVVFLADPLSAVFLVVTLPLIPVFMVLIGWATQAVQARQWERLQALASGFVDTVGGLATLKIFGRAERQATRIRALTEDYRVHTMKVLRVTFVSGFVLELAGSLSVALVAVSIGLRLVDGSLGLAVGLFVLVLAPDVFLPVRQVGAEFHAAADGVQAADRAFAVLERAAALPARGKAPAATGALELRGLAVDDGRGRTLAPVDAVLPVGSITVVTGPSGSGKSTLIAALAGFVPFSGTLLLGGSPVADLRSTLAWAGQRPDLLPGSVASAVGLGALSPDPERVRRALAIAAVDVDPERRLDAEGTGLSGGQSARVAVARAVHRLLERGCAVLALDEPTAALDDESERALLAGLRSLAESGTIVVVASHRPATVAAADAVIALAPAEAVAR
ncbi:thiol reductant ABC exporter subunit CydD [Rathayibacter sp. AY1B7]|uniref:thiol reductant ABC exporter subunit CydD n=1 Tax=unclassified Rathayibacter TaxID=2609250 RepID=UPI000CE7BE1A|nr:MULTISPECIES: thiol reductant ABC exporter subunit CydD [unclassified Rathayibacter]PPF41152.1 thiol reductant ABC exporter subunit CydD [Rathayibacter sp. AY1A2]PPH12616.1 thiol reductant ABC exporter subunit CydD [Rathayibacter sp. AY1F8]PPH30642.1 thiol reductant ABC exporter subunit CydD [Rathayibacter sp. AY1F9]PPH49369.1 thiol reductant ABC exporter subunit CydD [Rathayibacter sp. AY1C9]PPH70335.1 thiol reductant ABC exporter subunit CydD [Rathayibacter sp. AY1D4]